MRPDIHPAYAVAKITCACGNTWETRSTGGDTHLDVCSACHPFFTGKQKLMDTQGRIDRFNKKYAATGGKPAAPAAKAEAPKAEAAPKAPKAEKAPKGEKKAEKAPKAKKDEAKA